MTEVKLTIHSAGGSRELTMKGDRLVIGRAEDAPRAAAALLIEDEGVAPRHASINREGGRVWVLDEGLTGGTFLNGQRVPPQGASLADGDEILIGEYTTIVVRLRAGAIADERAPHERAPQSRFKSTSLLPQSPLAVVVPVLCLVALVVIAVVLFRGRGAGERRESAALAGGQVNASSGGVTPSPDGGRDVSGEPSGVAAQPTSGDDGNNNLLDPALNNGAGVGNAEQPPGGAKLYLRMSREEQSRFLEERAQHVSMLMGNRPYAFNDEVLGYIKQYVDVYARRVGNGSQRMWGEDLQFVFGRARTRYAPHIIRAFNARGVPPVVGLYLAMIETEYHNIGSENFAGAAGLFQFIAPTARLYGVEPSERTNVEKMAPAAAHYMSDRIAEFGPDSMSVALAIAGYNRSPDSVRRDLRDVLASGNKERSFWTLVANSDRLDHWFQNENVKYVPKFFAAAIVGENPEAFGLEMRKLSTYTTPEVASAPQRAARSPQDAAGQYPER
jgi:hypothetical protein